jgi:deoxyribonuclease-1
MQALLLLLALVASDVTLALDANLPATRKSFTAAKNDLYKKVYAGHRRTFYCGCKYNARRQVDLASCGLQSLSSIARAKRVEAEHVFPAAQFGNFRRCWRNPRDFPSCIKSSGRTVSGRTCCQRVDPVFKAAHNDLMNLYPVVGYVNLRRSNYNWGMIPGEKRQFGVCNIEADSSIRRAEPPNEVMGDIARTMFYMSETYRFRLSRQDQQLYRAWSRQDPPDSWEIKRARHIKAIQGRGNRFVEDYADIFGHTTPRTDMHLGSKVWTHGKKLRLHRINIDDLLVAEGYAEFKEY